MTSPPPGEAERSLTYQEWERIRPPHCAFCSVKGPEACHPCILDYVVGDDGAAVISPLFPHQENT